MILHQLFFRDLAIGHVWWRDDPDQCDETCRPVGQQCRDLSWVYCGLQRLDAMCLWHVLHRMLLQLLHEVAQWMQTVDQKRTGFEWLCFLVPSYQSTCQRGEVPYPKTTVMGNTHTFLNDHSLQKHTFLPILRVDVLWFATSFDTCCEEHGWQFQLAQFGDGHPLHSEAKLYHDVQDMFGNLQKCWHVQDPYTPSWEHHRDESRHYEMLLTSYSVLLGPRLAGQNQSLNRHKSAHYRVTGFSSQISSSQISRVFLKQVPWKKQAKSLIALLGTSVAKYQIKRKQAKPQMQIRPKNIINLNKNCAGIFFNLFYIKCTFINLIHQDIQLYSDGEILRTLFGKFFSKIRSSKNTKSILRTLLRASYLERIPNHWITYFFGRVLARPHT